jgi:hypothetical protein
MSDELTGKPAFLSKQTAEALPYQGVSPDAVPNFDGELAVENDPDYMAEHNPPEGKGPSRGYQERWRAIARYHALGKTNNWICGKLGYSPTGVSLALKSEWVQAEVKRFRESYETDIMSKIKEAATDGVEVIHQVILDPNAKISDRLNASFWSAEKSTGKARQEVALESGTLSNFMDLLKQMQQRGETLDVTPNPTDPADIKEITGTVQEEQDRWGNWIETNL